MRSAALCSVEIDILRTHAIGTSSVLHRNTFIEQEHLHILVYTFDDKLRNVVLHWSAAFLFLSKLSIEGMQNLNCNFISTSI